MEVDERGDSEEYLKIKIGTQNVVENCEQAKNDLKGWSIKKRVKRNDRIFDECPAPKLFNFNKGC